MKKLVFLLVLTVALSAAPDCAAAVDASGDAERISVGIKGREGSTLRYYGDALVIQASHLTAAKYVFRLTPKDNPDYILHQKTVSAPESGRIEQEWSVTFASYKGEVAVRCYAVRNGDAGGPSEEPLGVICFTVQ